MLASIPWIESAQHNVVCNPIIDTYNAMESTAIQMWAHLGNRWVTVGDLKF